MIGNNMNQFIQPQLAIDNQYQANQNQLSQSQLKYENLNTNIQELENQDVQIKDMMNRQSLGFDRKLRDIAVSKKSVNKQGQKIDTLDSKASIIAPIKNLGYYTNKAEVNFQVELGKAITMISWNQIKGQFEFSNEAVQIIQRQNGSVSFVSIHGQSQSGKSTLLNLLLNVNENLNKRLDIFPINQQQINPQPQILLWSVPAYNQTNNSNIFFLDIQYSNEQQKTRQDIKLFYISMLLSSMAFINVKGGVSLDILQPFEPLLNLQESIKLESLEDKEDLSQILPKIVYVFRDFKHIILEQGKPIAGHSYLDNFIFDDSKFQKATSQQQKIRRRMVKYYRNKDGFSMVYPLNKSQDIKQLNNLGVYQLADEFQEEIKILRKNIMFNVQKKEFRGVFLTQMMCVSFINSMLEDVNMSSKIDLKTAFSVFLQNEFIFKYNQTVDLYNTLLTKSFEDDQYKTLVSLMEILRSAREKSLDFFSQLRAHDVEQAMLYYQQYHEKLISLISEKEKKIIAHNQQAQYSTMMDHLNRISQETKHQTANEALKSEDLETITSNYSKLLQTIMKSCINEKYQEEPVTKVVMQAQSDLVDLFYGEIKEMYTKNDMTSQQIQTLTNQHNQSKIMFQNQQSEKIKQYEDLKLTQEIKLKQLEEANAKHNQELDKFKKENNKIQQDLLSARRDLEKAIRERDDAIKKKAKCC